MINRNHSLSLVKQCQTLALARSGIYYQPKPESDANLKLMRLIDEIHLKRKDMESSRFYNVKLLFRSVTIQHAARLELTGLGMATVL